MSSARRTGTLLRLAFLGGLRPARLLIAWLPALLVALERPVLLGGSSPLDARRGTLVALALGTVLVPAVLDAALLLRRGVGNPIGWLLGTDVPAGVLGASWFLGRMGAVCLLALVPLGVLELDSNEWGAPWRELERIEHPALLFDGTEEHELGLGEEPPLRLVFDCLVLPGAGPAATLLVSVETDRGTFDQQARVTGRRTLELDLPTDARRLRLWRDPSGAWLLIPSDSVRLVEPGDSHAQKSLMLALQLVTVAALSLVLAAILGQRLRHGLVLGLIASGWIWIWNAPAIAGWPGADLFRDFATVSIGLVPSGPDRTGLVLAALGLGSGLTWLARRIARRSLT